MEVKKVGKIISLLYHDGRHFPWESHCCYGTRVRDLCPLCLARVILYCLYGFVRAHIGRGGLIWAVVDVSDPNTTVNIKVDKLTWEFTISTLLSQGLDKPYFPGFWV